jgi:hypothetical protein
MMDRMKKMLLMMVGMLALMQSHAQEVLVSDVPALPPFEGVIGYHIRYEGKVDARMIPYLPDSMTMYVGKNGLLYRYHGGEAAKLQSQLVWDGEAQEFWLLDPSHEIAESRWTLWKGTLAKSAIVPKETLKVAGKSTKVYTLTTEKAVEKAGKKVIEKQIEKVWVNDSIYFGGTLIDTLKLQQPAFLAAGLRAIPLQARRTQPGEVVTVLTAVSITPAPQNIWQFKVPEAYRMKEFDPSKPWHPIIERTKGN